MLITNIDELRLIYPNHALDSIDGMIGFIDNSEHGFLEDKLGTPLYEALCKWYDENPPNTRRSNVTTQTGYWNRLLLMAQRCVGFDALGRSAGMQVASVNNSGINMSIAGDYPHADEKAVETYRKTAFSEAMKSCDLMLAELEKWTTALTKEEQPDADMGQIVELWRKSRYFYLAASMLIPSAVVLQQYIDFSESREKFIRMLPDLRFIQEEVLANAIGEEYLSHLIDVSLAQAGDAQPITAKSPLELRIIHQLRRVMVAWLGSRTSVLKYTKEEKIMFHDDGVRKMQDVSQFIRQHQSDLLELYSDKTEALEALKASPLYEESKQESEDAVPDARKPCCKSIKEEQDSSAACWTPPLL